MSKSDSRSPEQIMTEIDHTRSHIGETLAALERRLSPSELMSDVADVLNPVKRASGDFGRNLGVAVRENPLPTALIGLGIGWLAVAGSRERRPSTYTAAATTTPVMPDPALEDIDDVLESERLDPSRGGGKVGAGFPGSAEGGSRESTMRRARARISERVRRAGHENRQRAEKMMQAAKEKSAMAYEKTSEASSRITRRARTAASESGDFVRAHPIGVAAAVLGLGAIVAAVMVASSDRRRAEVLERARRLKAEARVKGEQAAKAVEGAAESVKEMAKKAATRAGLHEKGGPDQDPAASEVAGERASSADVQSPSTERTSYAAGGVS